MIQGELQVLQARWVLLDRKVIQGEQQVLLDRKVIQGEQQVLQD